MDGIVFHQRRSTLFFWCGCALVTAGVLAHLPMFLMGRATHFVLAGMPMGFGMLLGMGRSSPGSAPPPTACCRPHRAQLPWRWM